MPYTVREGFRVFSHVLFLVLPATEAAHVFNARAAAAAAAVADLARAWCAYSGSHKAKVHSTAAARGLEFPSLSLAGLLWCGVGLVLLAYMESGRSPHPHTRPSYQQCLQLPPQLPRLMQRQPSKIERVLFDSFTYKAVHVTAQCCTVQLDCMSVEYLA